jgi:hypothetical protein
VGAVAPGIDFAGGEFRSELVVYFRAWSFFFQSFTELGAESIFGFGGVDGIDAGSLVAVLGNAMFSNVTLPNCFDCERWRGILGACRKGLDMSIRGFMRSRIFIRECARG